MASDIARSPGFQLPDPMNAQPIERAIDRQDRVAVNKCLRRQEAIEGIAVGHRQRSGNKRVLQGHRKDTETGSRGSRTDVGGEQVAPRKQALRRLEQEFISAQWANRDLIRTVLDPLTASHRQFWVVQQPPEQCVRINEQTHALPVLRTHLLCIPRFVKRVGYGYAPLPSASAGTRTTSPASGSCCGGSKAKLPLAHLNENFFAVERFLGQ